MPVLTVHSHKEIKQISFEKGEHLLQILQKRDIDITAPCGGNGTCGKCRVKVKNVGIVSSCTYYPESNIEVIIPNARESKIVSEQYRHTLKLPVKSNSLAQNSSYPIGLGIDIGTTSIVFYWINLITGNIAFTVGISNPQTKYGADVISRINFCKDESGLKSLQKVVIEAINKEIDNFTEREGIDSNNVVKISVSANTTMLHLLLGVNPTSIALVPFKPQFTEAKTLKAAELGIKIHSEAEVNILPSLSAYVGADIIAGLSSLNPPPTIKNYLFIDIGTNGEMAVVTPDKIWCCATAAGPAFEGANISCGMGAFEGAVSEYSADGFQTISDEKPIGICGSGLIDIVAYLLKEELVLMDGELTNEFVIASESESGSGKQIVITPRDIREVQLAKSAIITGIKILLESAACKYEDIDAVYLAGGFGNYLNPESAITIGLLPKEVKNKIITVGNTSGAGAVLHTLSEDFNERINTTLDKAHYIELSNHPDFEMEYAMNMFF